MFGKSHSFKPIKIFKANIINIYLFLYMKLKIRDPIRIIEVLVVNEKLVKT